MSGGRFRSVTNERADPMDETTFTLPDGQTKPILELTVEEAVLGGESDDIQ